MDTFGLGIALSFTDNATSGMQRASQAFQQMNGLANTLSKASTDSIANLTMLAYGMNQIGTQMVQVGEAITGAFVKVGKEVIRVGGILFSARMQLGALYGSPEAGEAVITRVKTFAQQSIFEFEDLLASVIRMKSVQIEAFDEITTSTGKNTQNLLEYAGDLAAFNPRMHNLYGTGIQAAMGSLIEYIAEANSISLKRGAGLDIQAILGEETGKTVAERTTQVADLLEKINMVGMVKGMYGTPSQKISNLRDMMFNLKTAVSDAGVFEKYTELVTLFADALFAIPQEELDALAKTIGDLIVSLMEPLSKLVTIATDLIIQIKDWIVANPEMAKTVAIWAGIAGTALLLVGTFLKLSSSTILIGLAFRQILGVSSFGGIFRNLGGSAVFLLTKLLPLVGIGLLIYSAWESNFMGIRDLFDKTFSDIGEKMSLIWNGISDKKMTQDEIARADALGVLPFIESIIALEYNLGDAIEGFKTGIADSLGGLFPKTVSGETINVFDELANFFNSFTGPGKAEAFTAIGDTLAKIFIFGSLAYGTLKAISLIKMASSFLLGGNFLLLAAGIGAVALAFTSKEDITAGLQSLSDNPLFREDVARNVESTASSLSKFGTAFTGFWDALTSGKPISAAQQKTLKDNLFTAITDIFVSLGDLAVTVGTELGNLLTKAFADLSTNATKIWNDISPSLILFFEGMATVVDAVATPVLNFISDAIIAGLEWIGSDAGSIEMNKFAANFGTQLGELLFGNAVDPVTGKKAGSWLSNLLTFDMGPAILNFIKALILAIDKALGDIGLYEMLYPTIPPVIDPNSFYPAGATPNTGVKYFDKDKASGYLLPNGNEDKDAAGNYLYPWLIRNGGYNVFDNPTLNKTMSNAYGQVTYSDGTTRTQLKPEVALDTPGALTNFVTLLGTYLENTGGLYDKEKIGGSATSKYWYGGLEGVDSEVLTTAGMLVRNLEIISQTGKNPWTGEEADLSTVMADLNGLATAMGVSADSLMNLFRIGADPYYSQNNKGETLGLDLENYTLNSTLVESILATGVAIDGAKGKAVEFGETLDGISGTYGIILDVKYKDSVYGDLSTGLPGALPWTPPSDQSQTEFNFGPPHAEGGLFSRPTLLRSNTGRPHLVGEAGEEAIIPINALWGQMDTKIKNAVAGGESTTMTFAAGSVVLQVNGATADEMQRAAKELMNFIEREQRLRSMARRKVGVTA